MKVILASPHGFCAGVVMAVECVERLLEILGPPLYVLHEIVHNKHIVDDFKARGVVFVEAVEQVPPGAPLVFSAHGVSPAVRHAARQRRLVTIDATCPLVAKVHAEAVRFARLGYTIVLIGHAGHEEVQGTMGEAPGQMVLVETPEHVEQLQVPDPQRIAYLMQTTLSMEDAQRVLSALKDRFPHIVGPPKDDICYATQNRQEAVRHLADQADVVLIVGSQNSSNSRRLAEVASACGTPAYLIENAQQIEPGWLEGASTVVLSAGASAPEYLVQECVEWLKHHYGAEVEERVVRQENVHFALPRELRQLAEVPTTVTIPATAPAAN